MTMWDSVWVNARIATCEDGYGIIEKGAIACQDGKIAWVGPMTKLPKAQAETAGAEIDVAGAFITPGLIDCHTHLVYAGNRANEFEMRLQGMHYTEIARKGGGIQATVNATREANAEALIALALPRIEAMVANGATTIEIKSGYGLNWETERKILQVAGQLKDYIPIDISRTFLGAHTIPREYKELPDHYVDLICHEMIPAVAREKLAEAVDVFCESIAFSMAQTEKIFAAAKLHQLQIKCHAEQLSNTHVAQLAAKFHAVSVDHLEFATAEDIEAIAKAGTIAVLLPGAFYYLQETQQPPIELLRKYKVGMALATDCNPGTSPIMSLRLIMNLACVLFKFTPEEALLGVTKNAAKALGLEKTHGTLTLGKNADFVLWNIEHPRELVYTMGDHLLQQVVKNASPLI